jgi:hypothetical protein
MPFGFSFIQNHFCHFANNEKSVEDIGLRNGLVVSSAFSRVCFCMKYQKNQLHEPKNTKIQDSNRDSDFKLKLALRARLRGNHQNNTIHVNNPK